MRAGLMAAVAACAVLAACGQNGQEQQGGSPDAPAKSILDARFIYSFEEDLSGDYAPMTSATVQNWTLDHIFIGGPHIFEAWLAGERQPERSPIMLIFKDAAGNDLTLAAGRFKLEEEGVAFEAGSPVTGMVSFEGQIDLDALETARRTLGSEAVVLKGTLTIGSQSFSNLGLKIKTGG